MKNLLFVLFVSTCLFSSCAMFHGKHHHGGKCACEETKKSSGGCADCKDADKSKDSGCKDCKK